ncbi:hypothetical protein KKD19_00355 [Patescibacteria group bacterium]|nr:hypothetical protein [Patescibacteria group bacterium]MBU4511683.1 hypothetical protein [Patescibacteria group bacterium]
MSLFHKEESKNKYIKYGILGGLLEVLYILVLISAGNAINHYFHQPNNQAFLIPMLFLTVFVFSVAVSALLVMGYPTYLFFVEKKLKQSLITIGFSLLTMCILGILLFVLIVSI